LLCAIFGVKGSDFKDPDFMVSHMGSYLVFLAAYQALAAAIGSVGGAAMIRAVAEVYAGHHPDWSQCLKRAIAKAPSVVTAAVLAYLGTVIGFLLFLAPGVYLAFTWILFTPVIIIENFGAAQSLSRSKALVSGSWCYVFCTVMVVTVSVSGFQMLYSNVLLGGTNGGYTLFSITGSIVSLIPVLLFGPIFGAMQFVVYVNLRVQKEGLNLDVLVRELDGIGGDESGAYAHVGTADKDPSVPLTCATDHETDFV
jgi:hypothetical protein